MKLLFLQQPALAHRTPYRHQSVPTLCSFSINTTPLCPSMAYARIFLNHVGVNAAVCKRAVWINSFKRSAFVYPHRNKLYRWRHLLPLDEEILRAYAIDGHSCGATIYRMNHITQTAACACHLKSSSVFSFQGVTPAPAIFQTP